MKSWILALTLALSPSLVLAQGVNQMQVDPKGNPTREFVMSCTYGVMAGTLVGLASLAFVDKPSDNLNRVARGASIGLYTGILLGLYVVYVVPGLEPSPESEEPDPLARAEKLPFLILPRLEENKLAGAELRLNVMRF